MVNRWDHYGFQLDKVWLVLSIILLLQIRGCLSNNLEGGALLKFRSKIDVDPYGVLKNCNWLGVHCVDAKLKSLIKFKRISNVEYLPDKHEINLSSITGPFEAANMESSMNFNHRKLLQETNNLPAAPVTNFIPRGFVPVPSTGSGSFLAVPKAVIMDVRGHSSDSLSPKHYLPSLIVTNTPFIHKNSEMMPSEKPGNWVYIISLLGTLLACAAIISSILHRTQGGSAIAPWQTGLSGPLRRALIAGVTKLKRLELEIACEDFSNVINTYPECIVFKGTLSRGVEIAVVSTVIASSRDWSRRSELLFREKIGGLSKITHKNFVNLLGYCSEDSPFMRMLVYEYAPNGSLFEHLHVKEFEKLDWACRMRIVMGVSYCLQFMHHEICPPHTVLDLQSNSIYLTDDYAAKLCDTSVWKEITTKPRKSIDHDFDPSESPDIRVKNNVYSFGVLLLEIISGKLQYSEEHGSIVHWATEFLNDKDNFKCLVDQSLISFKTNELEAICEVVQECIQQYPENRPTMQEVTARLRDSLGITPDVAMPRLSPLWWAELEILSLEAN